MSDMEKPQPLFVYRTVESNGVWKDGKTRPIETTFLFATRTPWVVHVTMATDQVAAAFDLERRQLIVATTSVGAAFAVPNSLYQLGSSEELFHIWFRIREGGEVIMRLDVPRGDVAAFLAETVRHVSRAEERVAMDQFIEEGLKEWNLSE